MTPVHRESLEANSQERAGLGQSSDGGFEWGYEGAGPRRLALALLADHCGDAQQAFDNYPVFTETVIAEFKGDEWSMTSEQVQAAIDQVVVVPMGRDIAGI